MSIEDMRGQWGRWPCALCDSETVDKRGTICPTCELRLDADHRLRKLEAAAAQLRLMDDEPAHLGRAWQNVKPKGEFL